MRIYDEGVNNMKNNMIGSPIHINTNFFYQGGTTRKIKHYHFTSWPDHDVPHEMSPFITFYRRVHSETFRLSGPLLVHCR